jgi:hypothetical protein
MTWNVQTTEHATNISVSIHVKAACLVERMPSALQLVTEQFANVPLDGLEILLLSASSVSYIR